MAQNFDISDYSFEDISYIFEPISGDNSLLFNDKEHDSVLLKESVDSLDVKDGGIYLDCTFGAGGHSEEILNRCENCKVIGLDRDPYTKKFAEILEQNYQDRFIYANGRFSQLDRALNLKSITQLDGVLMDLGISSMQVDTPRRGFSFQHDGPLDMRMEDRGITAEEFIAKASEEELAGVIFKYGDERKSRQIAKAIIAERNRGKIDRTLQLANIIKKAVGHYNDKIHPATRTFQALRIYVNEELKEIQEGLQKALSKLKTGGKLSVITFHSGEDKIVKEFMKEKAGKNNQSFSRYMPLPEDYNKKIAELKIINNKPLTPSEDELKSNQRARSAKLRVAEKIEVKKH